MSNFHPLKVVDHGTSEGGNLNNLKGEGLKSIYRRHELLRDSNTHDNGLVT